MERAAGPLSSVDELYLQRAGELAARGLGNTAPNPPVGAVLVRDGRVLGEGYHHRAGGAHAEVNALQAAGEARGATLYVSLEPCGHSGRTPPCANALVEAGVVRVVAGTLDPTSHGGSEYLRARGIEFAVAGDPRARDLIEIFARASAIERPYVALKMAMSLDGFVAARPGAREWLTSEPTRLYVRELRALYDAVMVGAGTVRADDPLLTVRPARRRLREYLRVVVCGADGISPKSRIFDSQEGYARTIVLAPGGLDAAVLGELERAAEVLLVGDARSLRVDLSRALVALRARGIFSVLCEGGPALAAEIVALGQADRFYWAVAPCMLGGDAAVPVLARACVAQSALRFDRFERSGPDAILSGTFERV